jgi:hypothetical protein
MVAAPLIVLFLLTVVGLIWLGRFRANGPALEMRATKRYRFLGQGGPDDPFRDDPYDD